VTIRYTVRDARGAKVRGRLKVRVVQPAPKPAPISTSPRSVESALARLGLPVGSADGFYDARTRRAACTWRTLMGRTAHRGLPTTAEARAIVAMRGLPRATSTMVTGVTVSVTCQAAFWVGADRQYRRVMAASTGKAGYRTRLGTHRVFITHRTWRYSTIYPDARMYKPMQFSGGQAMHGSATDALVKTYPASHGCVRMLHRDIDAMQAGGVGNGTLVRVIGRW
jgi:lipoprotein-anchoring transpeptidase ErfK/SrfK